MKLMISAIAIVFPLWSAVAQTTDSTKSDQPQSAAPGGTQPAPVIDVAGIGAGINKTNGKAVITQFFESSGAKDAGLMINDVITSVDGKDISSLDVSQIFGLLRGAPETKVLVKVQRTGEKAPLEFKVTRHPVDIGTFTFRSAPAGPPNVKSHGGHRSTLGDMVPAAP